jgi:hypothetical protein
MPDNTAERISMEELYGQVWDTKQLQAEYNVIGFAAGFVVVVRKADQVRGSLMFQHMPRFYYKFNKEGE